MIPLQGAIAAATPHKTPFPWFEFECFFQPAFAKRLADSFPDKGFKAIEKHTSTKTYSMLVREETKKRSNVFPALSDAWSESIDYFHSEQYKREMAKLAGFRSNMLNVEVNFWKYSPGHFLDKHTDKAEKALTQIIYFNSDWHAPDGGQLLLHSASDTDTQTRRVLPRLNHSAVIINGPGAVHSVEKVKSNSKNARRSLQIIFWKSGLQQ